MLPIPINRIAKRKIRERLEARQSSLLSRYKDVLERAELLGVGSEAWEAPAASMMTDVDVHTLEDVVGALRRLDAGTYGICSACDGPIEPARLAALPEAAECVDCVRFAGGTLPRWGIAVGHSR